MDYEKSCGKASVGAKDKTAECLVRATGISRACADCYGEQTACGALHCPIVCAFGASDKCVACVCKHCRVNFLKCAKLPCTLLPGNGCKDCPNYQPFQLWNQSRYIMYSVIFGVLYCIGFYCSVDSSLKYWFTNTTTNNTREERKITVMLYSRTYVRTAQ